MASNNGKSPYQPWKPNNGHFIEGDFKTTTQIW